MQFWEKMDLICFGIGIAAIVQGNWILALLMFLMYLIPTPQH